jgi:transcriptional regulator with XRE-family HTH domain
MALGPQRIRIMDGRMNVVGLRVKDRRIALEIKQDELCGRLASITYGKWAPSRLDIYRVEHGDRLVSDLEIIALAAALDCSTGWLLHGNQESMSSTAQAAQAFRDPNAEE